MKGTIRHSGLATGAAGSALRFNNTASTGGVMIDVSSDIATITA